MFFLYLLPLFLFIFLLTFSQIHNFLTLLFICCVNLRLVQSCTSPNYLFFNVYLTCLLVAFIILVVLNKMALISGKLFPILLLISVLVYHAETQGKKPVRFAVSSQENVRKTIYFRARPSTRECSSSRTWPAKSPCYGSMAINLRNLWKPPPETTRLWLCLRRWPHNESVWFVGKLSPRMLLLILFIFFIIQAG